MTGAVYKRTPNMQLGLLRFNFPNWSDDANNNMVIIDAGFAAFGIVIRGIWTNSTAYLANQMVVDTADGSLWRALVSHTSAATGTFAQDRAAHPTYWEVVDASVPGVIISETTPTQPVLPGQLWWESDTGVLFIYYSDGDSSQWVQITSGTTGNPVSTDSSIIWETGTGTPEGVVTAPVGSLFSRTDGGVSTTLYVKETGTGKTGWVAK